jgi:hypothetical protein
MKRDDMLWKTILEDTFDDFLRFFIPQSDDLFDLSKGVEYLDKELDQLFPPEGDEYKPRYVDKLVKVYTREGADEWILVHIEVQGYYDNQFAKHMFQYYSRIWDKYDRSIVAFAIFTDADRGFHPTVFERSFLGTSLCYRFNTYKIIDQPEAPLEESLNPFAMVVLTVKAALKGSRMGEVELFNLKLDLARRFLSRKMDKAKIRKIMSFLRYYIHFETQEMIDNFDREMAVITQNRNSMGIEEFLIDRAKREGIREGIKEGREQIKDELIKTQLRKKQLSTEQIAEIFEEPVERILSIKKDNEL